MKRKLTVTAGLAATLCAGATVWNPAHLDTVKNQSKRPFYSAAISALTSRGDSLLGLSPVSVLDKDIIPPGGDPHDYMSQARYFWPDPEKADGLPYINRDGETNPEIYRLDRDRLGEAARRITDLAVAWYLTGEEKYADKAVEQIRVWFLDEPTRMNPNLEYAQMIPGHNGGKGRCYGLLDTYSFVEMVSALPLLESSQAFTKADSEGLKRWFGNLVDWMLTSPQGEEESRQANNHSTAYDAQLIAFALYSGQEDIARKIAGEVGEKRIFTQIEPDGSQPHELWRTLSYGYSQYNLTHLLDILEMARINNLDMGSEVSPDGRSVEKALDYLARYTGRSGAEWPYKQISGMESKQQETLKDLYRMRLLNPERKDYADLYHRERRLDYADPFNLAYYHPRGKDDAFVEVIRQMEYALVCAEEAVKEDSNVAGGKVTPRTLDAEGNLVMVHPHDWCSGFFAGSLWQIYEYTGSPEWRDAALEWTWKIEPAIWHKGTHDLGFMIYDSFGKGYDLTGDVKLREATEQAAKTLSTRYSPKVGAIRSWDHNADKWKYPVIIDNMMNLELLFRGTQLTGDSTFNDIARHHADKTLANHFRPDGTSWHVVDYDPETGEVRMKCTAQGYADDSWWSRGQAWGLYGYAQCYGYTGDKHYLDMSRKIADFIIGLPNMPADQVPYWDMKMPEVENATPSEVVGDVPRDASAAAIIASGLYLLSEYEEDATKAAAYRRYADETLRNLTASYRIPTGEKKGFLLDHNTGHHPAGSEIDVPLNYADYYYIEALMRQ